MRSLSCSVQRRLTPAEIEVARSNMYNDQGKTAHLSSHPGMFVVCSVRSCLTCLSLKIGKSVLLPKGGFNLINNERRCVRFVTRIGIAVVAALALMVPLAASAHVTTRDGNNSGISNFQHVFVIMMENTSYTSLIGNPNAPFINATSQNFGSAANYFGVTHPSQPNYIAATSGSTNGVTGDGDVTVNVPNI